MLQIIQQVVLLIGTATGAATDAKTGYIYDWITYPMIIIGLILSIIQQQWVNVGIGAAIFAIMYIAYRFGKIGGGDVKIFTAVALLNPINQPVFLFTVLFFSAVSAMIFYAVFYTLKYRRIGIKFKDNQKGITKAVIFGAIIIFYFAMLAQMKLIGIPSMVIMLTPLLFGLLFIALQEGIKKNFFEAKIAISKLEEDEVIAEGRNPKNVEKMLKGNQLIGEKEKALLKKAGIKSLYVLRKLPPFGPFILVGVIAAIIQPDFMLFIFV
jgi:Flp pilus assembly protein protease CpaA